MENYILTPKGSFTFEDGLYSLVPPLRQYSSPCDIEGCSNLTNRKRCRECFPSLISYQEEKKMITDIGFLVSIRKEINGTWNVVKFAYILHEFVKVNIQTFKTMRRFMGIMEYKFDNICQNRIEHFGSDFEKRYSDMFKE